jgi:hypothetical protein
MTIFSKFTGSLPRHRYGRVAIIALFVTALCSLALADGRIFRVARISLIEGEVSYQRANDSKTDWFDATLNLPLDESDQLYSGPDGRAEIQLSGRNVVRIDRHTNLRFTQFNTGTVQFALPIGVAYFRVDSLDKRQFHVVDANDPGANDPVYFEVDTPTVAVTFVKEGNYRINVRDDGTTEVIVRRGQAEVYNQEIGTVVVKKGRRLIIEGRDDFYQITKLEDKDSWDRWNDRRDDDMLARADNNRSARHVPVAIAGVYDLDYYGDWIETPDYGWVWSPRGVPGGWAPYRHGYWRWYPAYGWTWISYEPWGWAPYHYGRWTYYRSRWCWTPSINLGFGFDWGWRPHHVAFFGWGGSYRGGYRDGYWDGFRDGRFGWLGWCPLSPRDRHDRGGPRERTIETLGNYNSPGGVSGMDAGRFTGGRVVVSQDVLNAPAPPRDATSGADAPARVVQTEALKPIQAVAPTRNESVTRAGIARKIEAPVVMRRLPVDAANPVRAFDAGSRPTRDGQVVPSAPARSGDPSATTPSRDSDEPVGRNGRPSRAPEYKPVERSTAPIWRSDENRRSPERNNESSRPSRGANDSSPTPNREVERPSRSEKPREEPPRRYDPPPRPQSERREPPRESPPPRESRRPDPPPSRESSPPRSPERPSSPPPARESAPSRPERPSAPPARESAPSRPERSPERPAPSRKPDSQG